MHDHFQDSVKENLKFHAIDVDHLLIERAKKETAALNDCSGTDTPENAAAEKNKYDNIVFEAMDITNDCAKQELQGILASYGRDKFDIVFCFSVSMWIHLNHGDSGLERFFCRLSELSDLVILEPQPWKCYQTAARRMRKRLQPGFEQMKNIRFTGDQLEPYIMSLCAKFGLLPVKTLGETHWKRKLIVLKKENERIN